MLRSELISVDRSAVIMGLPMSGKTIALRLIKGTKAEIVCSKQEEKESLCTS